jgi:phosphate transport system substrate-binding protein
VKTSRILALAAAAALVAGAASARDQIRIVGSSTVFPFSTAVAEQFGKTTDFATPVVESTGSGGGLKLFCAGVGEEHPDISSALITASPISPKSSSALTASWLPMPRPRRSLP